MTRRVDESVCAAVGAEPRIQMAAGSDEVLRVGGGHDAIFDGTLGADPALVARPFGDTRKDRGVYVVEVQEALALPPVTAFTEVLTGIQRSSA